MTGRHLIALPITLLAVALIAVFAVMRAGQPVTVFDASFSGPAGSAPNASQWHYNLGSTGFGAGQLETYTASRANSYLDGLGHLVIAVTKTASGYNSARLVSRAAFTEGDTFRARIKLDVQPGIWPAWWMMGTHWPASGEVDFLENYGGWFTETTVHTPAGPDTMYARFARLPADNNWHTYTVTWTAAGFTFSRDGTRYLTVTPSQLKNWGYSPGTPMHMILNIAAGGIAGTPPPSVHFPVTMEVDWVQVTR
jgi:beta-glucanase (GH16 family)